MGLQNYQPREHITKKDYRLFYETSEGRGFSFDCDEHGNVNEIKLYHQGVLDNYLKCKSGAVETIRPARVESEEYSYYEDAHGTCSHCGSEVYLTNTSPEFAYLGNECPCCDALYNLSGQELRPRSEWEERIEDDY